MRAYGLFVGGQDLEGDDQKYLYFLIRRSGEFLIKTRAGDETSVVHPWTVERCDHPVHGYYGGHRS